MEPDEQDDSTPSSLASRIERLQSSVGGVVQPTPGQGRVTIMGAPSSRRVTGALSNRVFGTGALPQLPESATPLGDSDQQSSPFVSAPAPQAKKIIVPEQSEAPNSFDEQDDDTLTNLATVGRSDRREIPRRDDDPDLSRLRTQIAQLQSEVTNVRRRSEQEKSEFVGKARAEIVSHFIPILDDLDDALAHIPEPLWGDPWVAGVLLVGDRVQALLESEGVRPVTPLGQQFNPHFHEAVSLVEGDDVPEGATNNTVVNVFRTGYVCNGQVLRPAQVQVAKVRKVK